MAIKKVKSAQKKNAKPVAIAPDLEEKRKKFQQAVSHHKAKSSTKKNQPKHHTARKRTLIVIVGALLAIVGSVVVAYAYFFWYHSPEKIVSDALTNAAAAQTVKYDIEVNSPTMSLAAIRGSYKDGGSQASAVIRTTLPGELNTVNASFVSTNKDMYAKVTHASQLAREITPQSQRKVIDALLPSIQDSIDDKWVHIVASDTSLFQSVTKTSSCVVDAVQRLSVSKQARTAVAQTYMQHAFFVIKEVKTDKNAGTYQLTIDPVKFHAFLDAITASSPTLPFSRCNKELATIKASTIDSSVLELIVDKTSRTITHATVSTSGSDAVTVMISPVFGQDITITEPQGATRFSDIKSQFYQLFSLTQTN